MNNELIDRHLDTILRASGSALRNYSMPKTIEAMRAALAGAIKAAHTQQQEAEPVAWILTGTDRDLVPRRYLLFSGREAELHVAQNLAGGERQSCAAKPLYLHPPRPAAQPQPEPFPMQVTDGGRNELYEGLFDDETARERDDRLRRARAAQPVTMASRVADALEAANWSGVTSGNQCLILSAIDHLRAARPQVPEGYQLVPVATTMKIESAIAASRNLKASEIWEDALSAAKEETPCQK